MNNREDRFIQYLIDLGKKKDRGPLAALRHSLAFEPGQYLKALPLVEPFVAKEWHAQDSRRLALYAVAGLYAKHPKHQQGKAVSAAFGEFQKDRRNEGRSNSLERRFIALLEADDSAVLDHLRQVIALLASADMGLDYRQLLHDLNIWLNAQSPNLDKIKQRWARDFYIANLSSDEETTTN
jgi:CRISPR system Cascade subunit CasB